MSHLRLAKRWHGILLRKCRFFVAGNGIDKPARHATQADALHEYYMNSGQLPRHIVEVRAGSGPQSVTNLLQYLYTKPAPLPAKPSGSSATYQQGNKKPVTTKDHH